MDADGLYLVAVSGGADSVCLLLMLQQLDYHIEAVHCNFHLRGAESDRDEQFVKDLCHRHNIPLHLTHFDTTVYTELHQVSIEMAARQLRYHYFEQLRHDLGADGICVAHHRDDSVETILLNLMRGTGIHGLCGIRPRRDHILRPLLCLSRTDIEQWLDEQQQTYVTDSTNRQDDVQRNFLRLDVIPRLRERWPSMADSITSTARRLTEAVKVYEAAMQHTLQRLVAENRLPIEALLQEPSPESVLYEWLSPLGFTPAVIEQVARRLADAHEGSTWQSATLEGRTWQSANHELAVHQGHLLVQPLSAANRPTLRVPETGTYVYDTDERFRVSISDGHVIDRRPNVCCLDADTVAFPLIIRPTRPGDRFQPLGMKGTRLVSDYLCDRKLSVFDRRRQLVVTAADGHILWLVGHRPAHPYRVTELTKRTLNIELSPLNIGH